MEDTWLGAKRIDFVWYWMDRDAGPWKNVLPTESNVENFPPWSREPVRPTKECLAIDRQHHQHPNFIDLDCRLQRPFICQKKDSEINSPIPSKWVQINRNTFTLYHGKVTWQEAAIYCRTQGSRLAVIKNLIVTHILSNSMTKTRPDFESVWIGAYFNDGNWIWLSTGSILNSLTDESGYPPWRYGRPEANSGCLLLDRHMEKNSTFLEVSCDHKRSFICEEYTDDEENDWWDDPIKFSYDNNTYVIYPLEKTWNESASHCISSGSVLAQLNNINTVSMIIEAMGDHPRELSHVWLGGHYNPKTDEWFWSSSHKKIPKDKDESGFPPWTNIEGDDGIVSQPSSTCLNLDRADHVKAHFYGLDCDSKQPFVCKTTCDIPPTISNGTWNCINILNGRECSLRCTKNLMINGVNTITCTLNNGWIAGENLMEFPTCSNISDYTRRIIHSLGEDIRRSSAYYLLMDHSAQNIKSSALKFAQNILKAFPASNQLRTGMTSYITDPPVFLSFNQTNNCLLVSALKYLQNSTLKNITVVANIKRINKDISTYNGRKITIIAVIDFDRGSHYVDILMHFKAIGHHITIIGLREHLKLLLPLATIGSDHRANLFLFQDNEFEMIVNELQKQKKKLKCADYPVNSTANNFVVVEKTNSGNQPAKNPEPSLISTSPSQIKEQVPATEENPQTSITEGTTTVENDYDQER
ncbi:hypothetical protein KQX54_003197 [Cotesia glomerata]|uniref:Uncharacterized protein n=2 Tax=Cotesia glomerata TaxID=32391 RepID=A0AAV7I9F5_COTGL|nr:hypothetical protein KQX54_003197 [Cotesia glomerata]